MKKALAILLALALVAGAAFAEEPAYTLTGSASMTWGLNLDTEAHGFTNTAAAKLVFPLGAKGDKKTGDAITGEISISEFSVGISTEAATADTAVLTATTGAVAAKILFPSNLYMQIAAKPGFTVANAASFAPWYNDEHTARDVVKGSITSAGGFTFGMAGDLNFSVKVGSTNTHTATAAAAGTATKEVYIATGTETAATGVTYTDLNGAAQALPLTAGGVYVKVKAGAAAGAAPANRYHAGVTFGTKLGDMGTLAVNSAFGSFGDDPMTVAAGAKVVLTPMDGFKATVGVDFQNKGTVNGLDANLILNYTMASVFGFDFGAYFGKADLTGTTNILDMMARFNLLAVPGLTFKVGADLWNMAATPATKEILIVGNLGYKADMGEGNHVSPYFNAAYSLKSENLYMSTGANMKFFPLTTFTLDYTAGKTANNVITIPTGVGTEAGKSKGTITFKTAIAY